MNIKSCARLLLAVGAFLSAPFDAKAKQDNFPRLPGAELLMGYPGSNLMVTTPSQRWILQEGEGDMGIVPSMSRDGTTIAAARVHPDIPRAHPILAIATYSIPDKKWREYKSLAYYGSVAISPDGSKLAIDVPQLGTPEGVHIVIIDLKTGTETVGPVIGPYRAIGLSWSPDGTRITYGMNIPLLANGPPLHSAIQILDLETGRISQVEKGQEPAWSPSGEWIAYLDSGGRPNRILMVHPDGTGAKVLVTLPGDERIFHDSAPPVWSPDSTQLLVNEIDDPDRWTFNIHRLDLATLHLTKKFKHKAPVYGWAELK